jgi:predicted enzyme related to lactoylglutathione lyase
MHSDVPVNRDVDMVKHHGRFAWYELLTTDTAAAKAFYHDVVGWGAEDASTPQLDYTRFTAGEIAVGGLMELPEEGRKMGATPRWLGYVAVDDVDGTVELLKRLDGTVYVPPTDSNIGRIALVADRQTATLALVSGLTSGGSSDEPDGPGRVGWHELLAADATTAFGFYSELFGWQPGAAENDQMDSYQLLSAGGRTIGGMFTKLRRAPFPFWLYYFNVVDMDAAMADVKARGGKVVQGPLELVDDSWITRCIDPQGAMFALQGKRSRSDIESPATELNWAAEWGGFASRGRVVAKSAREPQPPKPGVKSPSARPKR